PTATAIAPVSGTTLGGTSVTITGTNFAAGAAVAFGGTVATGVVVVNATTITAMTPAHAAGTVAVTVTNNDTPVATLPAAFTFIAPPAPVSITPAFGTIAGGTLVTIGGSAFAAGATVTIGGVAATIGTITATSITATTDAHAAGVVDVVVTNPDGQ